METNYCILDNPSIKIIIIIFICGLIGGIGNSLREVNYDRAGLLKNIFLGVIASITVPLFLNLVSSDILKAIYKNEAQNIINYLIFSGFCIIASFSSLNFLNTISGKVLQNLKEEIKELKTDNVSLKETNQRLDNNITALAPISSENKTLSNTQDIERFKNPSFIEIMSSIQNVDNKFKPLNDVKIEVQQNNSDIDKKIEILKENNLIKEIVSGEGEKAVALTEEAENILSKE